MPSKGLVAALIAAGLVLASPVAHAQSAPQPMAEKSERYKVVIQVSDNDPAKWNLALNNARNVQADLGKENVDVEIVAYGPGLAMLRDDSIIANRLAEALDQNIGLMACENTMRSTKVGKKDMHSGVSFVDAGVVHIMRRQRAGWGYVRP